MATINVALIGQGFMGRTHSNGWGQVAKFFKPPIVPVMHTVYGQPEENPRVFADNWGWKNAVDRLGAVGQVAGDRAGRRGHAQLHARPGGPGGHRRRQAVLLREAHRRHAGRRPRNGAGGQGGQGEDLRLVQLSPLPGGGAGAPVGQGRQAWHDSPRAGRLLAGLGRRVGAVFVAISKGIGGLRRPWRSERPHHRHDPLRHGRRNHRNRRRDCRNVHQGTRHCPPAWPRAASRPAGKAAAAKGR